LSLIKHLNSSAETEWYHRTEGVIGSLGKVMSIEYDEKDKEWRAMTFVVTDANSFHYRIMSLTLEVNKRVRLIGSRHLTEI